MHGLGSSTVCDEVNSERDTPHLVNEGEILWRKCIVMFNREYLQIDFDITVNNFLITMV
jgi:hypothetical protein